MSVCSFSLTKRDELSELRARINKEKHEIIKAVLSEEWKTTAEICKTVKMNAMTVTGFLRSLVDGGEAEEALRVPDGCGRDSTRRIIAYKLKCATISTR